MDLAYSESQQMVRKLAGEFLEREFPTSLLRTIETDEKGLTPDLWRQMAELGLLSVAIPESYGGTGEDLMTLGVVSEQLGRHLYVGPFFATVVLGTLAVLYGGSEAQKRAILPRVAQGQTLLALALLEESGKYEAGDVRLQARRQGGNFVLRGTKLFVEYGHVADHLLVVGRTSAAPLGLTLFLVDRQTPGVKVTPLKTIGGDKQTEVEFQDVSVPAQNVVGQVDQAWPIVDRVLLAATALQCMQMAGMAERVLEKTVEYVKMRIQFGRPIGQFQAVQHHVANMAIFVDGAKLSAQEGVARLASGLPARREVSLAKAFCSRAGQEVTLTAHQLHGGVGFMQEFDLQFYTRQMESLVLRLGTMQDHLKVVSRETMARERDTLLTR